MTAKPLIVAVSDASLGFGSPQVPEFVRSLRGHYGGEAVILEPDVLDKPPRHELYPDLKIERLNTAVNPYVPEGRIRYLLAVANRINELQPDVLVVFCTFCLPVLFKLLRRPKFVIYHSIESIVFYGETDLAMNRAAAEWIDLVIFPEENRASRDLERCEFHGLPIVEMLNSANPRSSKDQIVPFDRRNGRLISQGAIAWAQTFPEYYLRDEAQRLPVDLYGPIGGPDSERLANELAAMRKNVRYHGVVDLHRLAEIRRNYCYSIVIWTPAVERALFAPSNKFFEAIADGVPPITAPHPQHKQLVERYRCGIVMDDWSYESFYRAVCRALRLYGTSQYADMVENCRVAVAEELNWEHQFEAVRPYLHKAA
ncbi:MAG TPA: hypothetical protein VFW87_14920 [Pirellulales bacterium]|nr:hypothetical protein [Pirellulales bacterium]